MKNTKTKRTAKTRSGSLERVVRCCATCADWNPQRMECRYEQNVAAPPQYCCSGWRLNLNTNGHWRDYAETAVDKEAQLIGAKIAVKNMQQHIAKLEGTTAKLKPEDKHELDRAIVRQRIQIIEMEKAPNAEVSEAADKKR